MCILYLVLSLYTYIVHYAVVRQISMLFINNKDSVFCLYWQPNYDCQKMKAIMYMGKRETVLPLTSNQLTASVADFVSEWMYQGSALKPVREISNNGNSKASNKSSLKKKYNSDITASYN